MEAINLVVFTPKHLQIWKIIYDGLSPNIWAFGLWHHKWSQIGKSLGDSRNSIIIDIISPDIQYLDMLHIAGNQSAAQNCQLIMPYFKFLHILKWWELWYFLQKFLVTYWFITELEGLRFEVQHWIFPFILLDMFFTWFFRVWDIRYRLSWLELGIYFVNHTPMHEMHPKLL